MFELFLNYKFLQVFCGELLFPLHIGHFLFVDSCSDFGTGKTLPVFHLLLQWSLIPNLSEILWIKKQHKSTKRKYPMCNGNSSSPQKTGRNLQFMNNFDARRLSMSMRLYFVKSQYTLQSSDGAGQVADVYHFKRAWLGFGLD